MLQNILLIAGLILCIAIMISSFYFCRYCDKWHTKCKCSEMNPYADALLKNCYWKCGICGEDLPDEDIKVLSYDLKDIFGATVNLKYCKKVECYQSAIERAQSGLL